MQNNHWQRKNSFNERPAIFTNLRSIHNINIISLTLKLQPMVWNFFTNGKLTCNCRRLKVIFQIEILSLLERRTRHWNHNVYVKCCLQPHTKIFYCRNFVLKFRFKIQTVANIRFKIQTVASKLSLWWEYCVMLDECDDQVTWCAIKRKYFIPVDEIMNIIILRKKLCDMTNSNRFLKM